MSDEKEKQPPSEVPQAPVPQAPVYPMPMPAYPVKDETPSYVNQRTTAPPPPPPAPVPVPAPVPAPVGGRQYHEQCTAFFSLIIQVIHLFICYYGFQC
jgi:hypothetical protein